MVFLTGGTGLLGIRLLFDFISNGQEVRALRRPSSNLDIVKKAFLFYDPKDGNRKFEKVHWCEGDVLDLVSLRNGMESCDEIYHAAALVSFHKKDRETMLETNIQGTANVVNLALELDIKKFCHISSIAALGRTNNAKPLNENDLWTDEGNPSHYSISKYYSEMEVWRGIEEGLNAVILCPSLIMGAGRPDISSGKIYSTVWNGLKAVGPNLNSIIDARSISFAASLLMEKEIWKERFILSAHDLLAKDLFKGVADSLGKKAPSKILKISTIKWASRVLGILARIGIELKVSQEMLAGALLDFRYDNSKLSKFIDIEYPGFEETINYYGKYYKDLLGN